MHRLRLHQISDNGLSPSGDNFYPDDNTSIKWLSAFNGSNVKLEYYHNQSSTWHTISSSYLTMWVE